MNRANGKQGRQADGVDMILLSGSAAGTTLTGTVYEPDDESPRFRGAPDDDAPFVWICDEFYEVASGGSKQSLDGREIRVAFETPIPRGFETREGVLSGAKEHLRTQFARVGIDGNDVEISRAEG